MSSFVKIVLIMNFWSYKISKLSPDPLLFCVSNSIIAVQNEQCNVYREGDLLVFLKSAMLSAPETNRFHYLKKIYV